MSTETGKTDDELMHEIRDDMPDADNALIELTARGWTDHDMSIWVQRHPHEHNDT